MQKATWTETESETSELVERNATTTIPCPHPQPGSVKVLLYVVDMLTNFS